MHLVGIKQTHAASPIGSPKMGDGAGAGTGVQDAACVVAGGNGHQHPKQQAAAPKPKLTLQAARVRSALVRRAVIISVSFVVLWFTYAFLFMYQLLWQRQLPPLVDAAIRILVATNAAINPVIFFAVDERYSKSLREWTGNLRRSAVGLVVAARRTSRLSATRSSVTVRESWMIRTPQSSFTASSSWHA
ncbi:hypothetical protein BC831DRAFT_451983 [Entophlyctis helioformis]|nr:hypothetical protein BC831DRAFT_451983 [Entophlyctis helioformis]